MTEKPSFPVLMAPARWGSVAALSPLEAYAKIAALAAASVRSDTPKQDDDVAAAEEAIAIFSGQLLAWSESSHSITGLKAQLLMVIDKISGYDREGAEQAERKADNDNAAAEPGAVA
jgi:hypothetical protein